MRTIGSTKSRFCKRSETKSSGMPRRRTVPRESPTPTKTQTDRAGRFFCIIVFIFNVLLKNSKAITIKKLPIGSFYYISSGIFKPINSIDCDNTFNDCFTIASLCALMSSGISSRIMGQV